MIQRLGELTAEEQQLACLEEHYRLSVRYEA